FSSSGEAMAVTTMESETGGVCWADADADGRRSATARSRRGRKRALIRTSRSTRREISEGLEKDPAPAGIHRRAHYGAPTEKRFVRQVSWLPDPPLAGLLPERATVPIRRVQWFRARGVPGDSGGGRAGFTPASLTPNESKIRRRALTILLAGSVFKTDMIGVPCGRTSRSISIG